MFEFFQRLFGPGLKSAGDYVERAKVRMEDGRYKSAVADCNEAIRLDPTFAGAFSCRGYAYQNTGETDKAIDDFTEALRLQPADAELHYSRGTAYAFFQNALDKAIIDFTETIRLDPQHGHAWCNRGSARLDMGEYDKAIEDFNEALRLDPSDDVAVVQKFVAAANRKLTNQKEGSHGNDGETEPPRSWQQSLATCRADDIKVKEAEEEDWSPSSLRVAARTLVLAAVVYRSCIEQRADGQQGRREGFEPFRRGLLDWIDSLGLSGELDQLEREFLEARPGRVKEQTIINGLWRREGLGVLAWALNRYDLPAYDQCVDLPAVADNLAFLDSGCAGRFLGSAALRPSSDISWLSSCASIVHWRLRQFSLAPGPMDYQEYLRQHPLFKGIGLSGVRFIDGDLAIGDKPVAAADADEFQNCLSIAMERAQAVYWLQGDAAVYEDVDTPTFLSGC